MAWSVVEVDRSKKNRALPSASVGYGRLGLNVAACNLLGNFSQYKYAELLTDATRPSIVGVRFLVEATERSVLLKRKEIKGKVVGGLEIQAKNHMEKLFGLAGTQKKTTSYPATKDPDSNNILIISVK